MNEVTQLILEAITAASIALVAIQITIQRKQLNIVVIEKCSNSYRELMSNPNFMEDDRLAEQYVDLVNEELFYIKKKYLPTDVAKEWLDGMINYLPLTNGAGILNDHYVRVSQNFHTILGSFPRVKRTFSISDNHPDITQVYCTDIPTRVSARKKLIKTLLSNLKDFHDYD